MKTPSQIVCAAAVCVFYDVNNQQGRAAAMSDVMKNLAEVPVVAAAQTHCSACAQGDTCEITQPDHVD